VHLSELKSYEEFQIEDAHCTMHNLHNLYIQAVNNLHCYTKRGMCFYLTVFPKLPFLSLIIFCKLVVNVYDYESDVLHGI